MRQKKFLVLVSLAALGWSHVCFADDLFGIAMKQPLNVQECIARQGSYLPDDHSQCFKWPADSAKSEAPPRDGTIIVNVPLQDRPDFMSGADVEVGMKAGLVVSLSARTHGAERDTRDLEALEHAFGKSDPQYVFDGLNSYQSIRANWQLADGSKVYFNSSEFGRYNGLVRIQAP